ncbi:FERM domain containing protein 1 [Dissostichus eleginoides]|uniref:FERM domain containing protein 1 n=1 Tax=Dissostichus eleginoides TaxID=100907 RepID=A0AAD9EXK5_DISEL|nr:FERM domain containing protein 1 [Dissostichus eleginoides]
MRTSQKRQVSILLPNKQHLDCTVRVRARGQEVLNRVLKQLGVSELQVLGLAVLRDNEYLFVDLEQKLSKYFGKTWKRGSLMVPFILFLRVQYYVESGLLIMSSKVQQLYYAELRQKVLLSKSRHQEAVFFQLAASALQAEDYFPSWLIKRRGRDFLLQHCPGLHAELRGVTRGQAILQFIKEAGNLQDGAVTFYRMRQEKKELRSLILLGVASKGVHIYQELEGKLCLLYDLTWTHVDRLTFQGSRFEISAVGSLCLPQLVFYTASACHSKHILTHLRDSHRLHINTRAAVCCIQQLEDMQASHLYKEAYICDTTRLAQRLQTNSLSSSMSDCSVAIQTTTAWSKEEECEEEQVREFELCVDEPEEIFVDEVLWTAELSVDEPLIFPSSYWTAVAMEMKQVLRRRTDEGVSVD